MSATTTFGFKAIRRDGAMETGVVEAASRDAAAALVGRRGLFPIEVSAHERPQIPTLRVSADDLATGLRTLANLLGSGLSISRALSLLEDLTPASWAPALPDLRHRIDEGEHLSAALERSPLPLPAHVAGVIGAGDAGSHLGEAVESAARLLESRAATRASLRNALAYPLMLAVAGSASVFVLVAIVLPRFVSLLDESGQALPWTTRAVLAMGSLAGPALIPSLGILAVGAGLWAAWVRRPSGRLGWHRLVLRLPVFGRIRRSYATANGCAALSALLRAGVPLAAALPHAARATGDAAIETALSAARKRVVDGASLARAVAAEAALTPTAARFARIGEETGDLAGMLANAAEVESRDALQRLQRLIRLIEPAMILLFGLVVMIVAAALLQAMYGLRPSP